MPITHCVLKFIVFKFTLLIQNGIRQLGAESYVFKMPRVSEQPSWWDGE